VRQVCEGGFRGRTLVTIDFLVVPTVSFRLLFVFVVLGHRRRHTIHVNVKVLEVLNA